MRGVKPLLYPLVALGLLALVAFGIILFELLSGPSLATIPLGSKAPQTLYLPLPEREGEFPLLVARRDNTVDFRKWIVPRDLEEKLQVTLIGNGAEGTLDLGVPMIQESCISLGRVIIRKPEKGAKIRISILEGLEFPPNCRVVVCSPAGDSL